MRNKAAKILITTGIVCVLAALSLFLYNQFRSYNAGVYSQEIMVALKTAIDADKKADNSSQPSADTHSSDNSTGGSSIDRTTVLGSEYIGYLSIPTLALELPVMADWSYEKLDQAPCRYAGSPETDDFVIAAHNFSTHFGYIGHLTTGDQVSFTDIHGRRTDYEVILTDTLSPTSVSDMTSGEYALTLFTCTYSGQARVTVRLQRRATT